MSQSVIATIAVLCGAAVALVDGARSVRIAAVLAGAGLSPAAAGVGGVPAAGTLIAAGVAAAVAGSLGQRAAGWLPASRGLDPLVPVVAPDAALFGPRSGRAFGAAVSLVAASWLGLNIQVGVAATASGCIFAAAYVWLVGVVRLLRARALDDLAVGAVAISMATACGWILEVGPDALAEAGAVSGLAGVATLASGWLVGRRRRRPAAVA